MRSANQHLSADGDATSGNMQPRMAFEIEWGPSFSRFTGCHENSGRCLRMSETRLAARAPNPCSVARQAAIPSDRIALTVGRRTCSGLFL